MTTKTIIYVAVYVAVVLALFVIGTIAGRHKKAEYDERQLAVRGNAFKYGFLTMFIGLTLQMVLITGFQFGIEIYFLSSIICFCAGLTVYCVYAIWNDAYIGVNNTTKSVLIVDALACLFNLVAGISNLSDGEINPLTGYIPGALNLALAAAFGIILIAMFAKHIKDKNED